MRRIFSGTQREAIINHDGCCVSCGFIEQGLFATESESGTFETLCEECLAPKHLENFSQTVYQPAYLPELSGPVVAHFSRVAAWFYFAARMGKSLDLDCGFEGRLPAEVTDEKWWKSPIAQKSYQDSTKDLSLSPARLRMLRKAVEVYDFLRNRVDATRSHFGSPSTTVLQRTVGSEVFARNFRMIPMAVPVDRIRSWGTLSTFANHAISHSDSSSGSLKLDDRFSTTE